MENTKESPEWDEGETLIEMTHHHNGKRIGLKVLVPKLNKVTPDLIAEMVEAIERYKKEWDDAAK